MWRWRRATYSFNLTIVHSMQELHYIVSDNLCKKRFIADYKKFIKIGDEIISICKPNFNQNITMTRTGEVNLKLANLDIKGSDL